MYNAIRRGSKLHLDEEKSRLLVRSLGASNPYHNLTQHKQSRQSLSGSRSIHPLAKPAYGDQFQIYTHTSQQRFRQLHLPPAQFIPVVCKTENDDDESSDDNDLAHFRRSYVSQSTYLLRVADSNRSFSGLARTKTSYRFECRHSFSSKPGRTTGVKIPTPKTESSSSIGNTISSIDPVKLMNSAMDMLWYATKMLVSILVRLPGNALYYAMNSKERKAKITEIKEFAKKEFDHYWTGTKVRPTRKI